MREPSLTFVSSNLVLPPTVSYQLSSYRKHENVKKRAYEQRIREVEHASFTLLIFTATCRMAKEVIIFYERLASYLAEKRNQPNSHMMCRLIEGILRDIPHVCIYLHNILVSGKTEEELIQSLDAILT